MMEPSFTGMSVGGSRSVSDHHEMCECDCCDLVNRKIYRWAALQTLAQWEDMPLSDEMVCQSLRYFSSALLELAENISLVTRDRI